MIQFVTMITRKLGGALSNVRAYFNSLGLGPLDIPVVFIAILVGIFVALCISLQILATKLRLYFLPASRDLDK